MHVLFCCAASSRGGGAGEIRSPLSIAGTAVRTYICKYIPCIIWFSQVPFQLLNSRLEARHLAGFQLKILHLFQAGCQQFPCGL